MKLLAGITLIFSLLSGPAIAEVTAYDFEIIIFEDASGRYINTEQWQHELIEADGSLDEAQRNPGKTADDDTQPKITPIKGIGLNRYAKKLKAKKRYNVLVHKAWRQTGFEDNAAIDIPIDSRTLTAQGEKVNNVHGSVRIELGRYLHIYTDMIYQQPNREYNPALVGEDSKPWKQYPIKSHRRMRSKELHYLDHPMVGILVMAKPVDSG